MGSAYPPDQNQGIFVSVTVKVNSNPKNNSQKEDGRNLPFAAKKNDGQTKKISFK